MKYFSAKLFIIALVNLLVFVIVFSLLGNAPIYENTLSKISHNYKRVKVDGVTQIQHSKDAFVTLKPERFQNWDADIYYNIKEHLYSKEKGGFTQVKGAFFPLFPLVWKFSGLNGLQISLLNYLLFSISLIFFVKYYLATREKDQPLIFTLLLTLPSTVIFIIPYTEALFMFSMALAIFGHSQKKYNLYFIAGTSMAMLRPAVLIILVALVAIELLSWLQHKKSKQFFHSLMRMSLPFVTGTVFAILIQNISSGSFNTMSMAQNYWEGKIGIFNQISDWSVEGFGLNVFALFFIAIPACLFFLYSLITKDLFRSFYNKSLQLREDSRKLFFLISIFYLSLLFIIIFFTSQGNLHSFFRFTMCSPAFYIAALYFLSVQKEHFTKFTSVLISIPLLLLGIFLVKVDFGGNRLDFAYTGMFLSICSFYLLCFLANMNKVSRLSVSGILIMASIIWNTYLLNIFLNEGWIFT